MHTRIRSQFDERWAADQWIHSTCSLCGWTTSGFLNTVRGLAADHRHTHHPELPEPRARRRRPARSVWEKGGRDG